MRLGAEKNSTQKNADKCKKKGTTNYKKKIALISDLTLSSIVGKKGENAMRKCMLTHMHANHAPISPCKLKGGNETERQKKRGKNTYCGQDGEQIRRKMKK